MQAAVEVYGAVSKRFLPTPAKSHYTYNLRDLSKVFQGVLCAHTANLVPLDLIRLWHHECTRVFCDRLTCEEDIK